jgi:hypothetical protein
MVKNGGQACKPDSVRRVALPPRTVAIIPLGPGSHRDSSSLPEGPDELGSSPLLFGLAPRGVCRAPDVAIGAVGSYPTVSPLPTLSPTATRLRRLLSGRPKVFLRKATEAHHTGGLFSVALSVTGNLASLARTARRVSPLALPGALPLGLRRLVPKTFVPSRKHEDHGVRTFLPARPLAKEGPAITRLARRFYYTSAA